MFSALRAGSGTGGVGPKSSPISHLSETMSALLDTSPGQAAQAAYFSHSEQGRAGRGGTGGQGEAKSRLGNAGVGCLPCPLLLHPPCPPSPLFIHFSLFLEIKKQTNNTNSSPLIQGNFLLQNKELGACWRVNSVISGGEQCRGEAGCVGRGVAPLALKHEPLPRDGVCLGKVFSSLFSLPLLTCQ